MLQAVPQEREVCPVTELCTVQVLTISMKDNVPELSEVTIPNALASSLRLSCKVCEKDFGNFVDFQQHAKTHVENPKPESDPTSTPDESGDDNSINDFQSDFQDESTSHSLHSESSQMEAIARELIGLASSPQTKALEHNDTTTPVKSAPQCVKKASGHLEMTSVPSAVPADEVCCYLCISCAVCDTTFTADIGWEDHMMSQHPDLKPYQCAICGKEVNNMPSLRGHVFKVHNTFSQKICERKWNKRKQNIPGKTREPCYLCMGSGKSNLSALKNSEKVIPQDDPKVWLRKYEKRSKGKGSTECTVCGKVLSNTYFQKHMKIHTGFKTHKCPRCPKTYRESAGLRYHMRTHTGERPYRCTECGKTFTHHAAISRHMRIHTQAKIHPCQLCDKKFTRRDGLLKHMEIHNEKKEFDCSLCVQTFKHKPGLVRHYKTFHGVDVRALNPA